MLSVVSHQGPCYFGREVKQVAGPLKKNNSLNFNAWKDHAELITNIHIPLVLFRHVHWVRGAVYATNQWDDDDGNRNTSITWWVSASNTKPRVGGLSYMRTEGQSDVTAPVLIDHAMKQRRVIHIKCPNH
jgi:hypothetical protein